MYGLHPSDQLVLCRVAQVVSVNVSTSIARHPLVKAILEHCSWYSLLKRIDRISWSYRTTSMIKPLSVRAEPRVHCLREEPFFGAGLASLELVFKDDPLKLWFFWEEICMRIIHNDRWLVSDTIVFPNCHLEVVIFEIFWHEVPPACPDSEL